MSGKPGRIVQGILALLEGGARVSSREMQDVLGPSARRVALRMRKPGPLQQIRVIAWVQGLEGTRAYPMPVYVAGAGYCAPRPKPLTHTECARRCRQRNQGQVASVWDLARPKRGRTAVATLQDLTGGALGPRRA